MTEEDDRYFDLEALARYSGLSTRTLRRYMDDAEHPLPCHHVHSSGAKGGGRVLTAKRAFDAWVTSFPPYRPKAKPAKADLDRRVAAAVRSIRGE